LHKTLPKIFPHRHNFVEFSCRWTCCQAPLVIHLIHTCWTDFIMKIRRKNLRKAFRAIILSSMVAGSVCRPAWATDFYWDNNDTTLGFGTAAGSWAVSTVGSATQGWSTSSAGTLTPGTVTTTTSDALFFGFGTNGLALGSISVSGGTGTTTTVAANSLTFNSNSGVITLGTNNTSTSYITLGGTSPTINVNSSAATIQSPILGTVGVTINGTGVLTLSAANNFGSASTSGLTISSGATVKAGTTGSAGPNNTYLTVNGIYDLNGVGSTSYGLRGTDTSAVVQNSSTASATLGVGGNLTTSYAGSISQGSATGTISILKQSTSTTTLTNTTMNFSGSVEIQNGGLTVSTLGDTGTGRLGSGDFRLGFLGNTGVLTYQGTGTATTTRGINMFGASTGGGATIDSSGAGSLTLGGAYTSSTNSVTKTLTLQGTSTGTMGGAILNSNIATSTSTLNVTKTGTGTWILANSGTTTSNYSGATTVSQGTLAGVGANAFGSTSAIGIAGAATLSLRGDTSTSFVRASDSVAYTVRPSASAATINVTSATGSTATKTMSIGAISPTSTAAGFQLNFTGSNNTSLTTGAFTGPASTGTSTASMTVNNTIASSGALSIASYTSASTASGGENFIVAGTGNTSIGAIAPNPSTSGATLSLTKNGSGVLTLTTDNTYTGVTTLNAGSLAISTANALGSGTSGTVIATNGTTNTTGQLRLSGGITVAENFTFTGSTEQSNFSSAIRSDSGTNVLSGTIDLSGVNAGGGIRINTISGTSSASLNITGNIISSGVGVGTGTGLPGLTLQTQNSGTNAGVISVANAIGINGGNLSIIGNAAGTAPGSHVILNSASGSGIGQTIVNGRGTLRLGVNDALNTLESLRIGQSSVNTTTQAGADVATVDLNGYNLMVGALEGYANNGTGTNNASLSSNRVVTNGGTSSSLLTVGNGGGSGSFDGEINNGAGTVALTKVGTGTQILRGASSYSGATTINDGVLQAGSAATTAFGNLSAVTLANTAGAALDLNSINQTIGSLAGGGLTGGNVTLGSAILTAGGDNTSTTYDGVISGTGGGFTKEGTGSLTLTGANTYTGPTDVNAGTLVVNGSLDIGAVTVLSGATLAGNGTIGGPTTISGIHAPGSNGTGIQSFTDDLTYNTGSSLNWELVVNSTTPRGLGGFDGLNLTTATADLNFAGLTTIGLDFDTGVDWTDGFWGSSYTGTSGWKIYDLNGGTISNFSNLFLGGSYLDSVSASLSSVRSGATFSLFQDGSNGIYLEYNFTPVPEPSLLSGALVFLGSWAIRRRSRRGRPQA
jgi:autotransporter-associated beta strand protein